MFDALLIEGIYIIQNYGSNEHLNTSKRIIGSTFTSLSIENTEQLYFLFFSKYDKLLRYSQQLQKDIKKYRSA